MSLLMYSSKFHIPKVKIVILYNCAFIYDLFHSYQLKSYTFAMDEKAKDMMVDINQKIGGDICSELEDEELQVLSAGAAMTIEADMVLLCSCIMCHTCLRLNPRQNLPLFWYQ